MLWLSYQMKGLESRFAIEQSKSPSLSSLVNLGHAVEYQRYDRFTISKALHKLVEKDDYEKRDTEEIVDHLLGLSHSNRGEKQSDSMA